MLDLCGHGYIALMASSVENLAYGVLEIGCTAQREYADHDIDFLSSIANIAAAAVDKMKRDAALRVADDRLQDVIEEQRSSSEAANLSRMRSDGGDWDRCRE